MTLTVNYAALNLLVQTLTTSATTITERLDELEAQLEPLRANWEGEAQTAYIAAKAQWDSAMADMLRILSQAGVNVNNSIDSYQGADRRGASYFA